MLGGKGKGIPLIAAVGFAYKVVSDTSDGGVPWLILFIQSHEHGTMMGITLIKPPRADTMVYQLRINTTAPQIVKTYRCTSVNLG